MLLFDLLWGFNSRLIHHSSTIHYVCRIILPLMIKIVCVCMCVCECQGLLLPSIEIQAMSAAVELGVRLDHGAV